MRQATALWQTGPGEVQLQHQALGERQSGQLMIRNMFSGVSRGTERLVLEGLVPESERERMRGPGMEGSFPFPVKYGYASVGRIEDGPPELRDRAVFVLHPHQDLFIVSEEQINLLPDALPPRRAVLAANMETALNIIWDAGILPGDRVVVFGAGVVGTLVAYLSNGIAGTETLLVDSNPDRSALAAELGLAFSNPGDLSGEFDVLINATASANALEAAIAHAGMEARIVEASWYGDRSVNIPLGGAFHARRLSLISSQVGTIPPNRASRWSYKRRMAKALELLVDTRLDALISGETAFSELEAAYPRILSSPDTLCHRIRYS
ncbi:dehydrogenase [Rhizobium sp. AAP43]|nr:dehydrogenase [Rhizobium sp. AAP43]